MTAALAQLRLDIGDARRAHETTRRQRYDAELALRRISEKLSSPHLDPVTRQQFEQERRQRQAAFDTTAAEEDAAGERWHGAQQAYDEAAATEPPLWAEDPTTPLLLLPVRLEVVFADVDDGGVELRVRVYPDDVHVDAHERPLTAEEHAAADRYDRAVAAAHDEAAQAAAWQALVDRLGPGRAAWALAARRLAPEEPRDSSWTRAARAGLLPHHFVLSAYVGGRLAWRHDGAPLPDPLAVGFTPGTDQTADELPWDAASRWLVDFDLAEAAGMAWRVRVDDPTGTIDLLTVVGVRTGEPAEVTAERWHDLLQAHQYTSGLGVLPAGTPTNNTDATRSAWRSRPRPRLPSEVDRLRQAYDPDGVQPAARAARAFGVAGDDVLALAPGALDDDQTLVGLAQRAVVAHLGLSVVWRPLDAQPGSESGEGDVGDVVEHAATHVRSRGPLPTLRIGRQPYGVLPATALDLWRGDDVDPRVVGHLRSFLTAFEERLDRVPRVGDGGDADTVLLDLLSRQPASDRVQRSWSNLRAQGQTDSPAPGVVGSVPVESELGLLGADLNHDAVMVVSDEPPPELQAVAALRPLREKVRLAEDVRSAATVDELNVVLGRFEALRTALAPLERWTGEGTTYTGVFYPLAEDVSHYLFNLAVEGGAHREPGPDVEAARRQYDRVKAVCDLLVQLEEHAADDMSSADRVLCEALDTTAHRVDAWATSLASARLAAERAARPSGVRVGAYGWLTDVRRRGGPGGGAPPERADGYVVAPSLHHATTAAVLRSGWQAHHDRSALAVDVQSWRVRQALALLEGVNHGRSMAALLGYQFERALHDAGLDRHLAALRAEYPLPGLVDPDAAGAAGARVMAGARQVVDGDAVRRRPPTAALVGADTARIAELVADLDDAVDAVGDLLLAESVHQLVGSNPQRAGLAADVVGRGEVVPDELAVVRTPTTATSVAHHVGLVVVPSTTSVAGWAEGRRLAELEPALEEWCRARLGAASAWQLACSGPTTVATPAELGWCALDVVTAAGPAGGDAAASTVGAAVLRAAGAEAFTPEGSARLGELLALCERLRSVLASGTPLLAGHLDPAAADPWTGVDLDDLQRRLGPWLTAAIAARDDLRAVAAVLDDAAGGDDPDVVAAALERARAAAVVTAELGVHPAPPGSGDDDATRAHAATLLARLDDAGLEPLPPPPGDGATGDGDAARAAWTALATGAATAVTTLVGTHLRVLPRLRLDLPRDGRPPEGADDDAVDDWLRDVALVRPAVAALQDAVVAAEVLGDARPGRWAVLQGSAPGQGWIATTPPGSGTARSALVVHHDGDAPGPSAEAVTVAGLVVDGWAEAVPRSAVEVQPDAQAGAEAEESSAPQELAGLAIHFDRPGARAPHAILVGVTPDPSRGWCAEDVHGVVEDTLRLARIRSLDLRDVPELRSLLPVPGPPSA